MIVGIVVNPEAASTPTEDVIVAVALQLELPYLRSGCHSGEVAVTGLYAQVHTVTGSLIHNHVAFFRRTNQSPQIIIVVLCLLCQFILLSTFLIAQVTVTIAVRSVHQAEPCCRCIVLRSGNSGLQLNIEGCITVHNTLRSLAIITGNNRGNCGEWITTHGSHALGCTYFLTILKEFISNGTGTFDLTGNLCVNFLERQLRTAIGSTGIVNPICQRAVVVVQITDTALNVLENIYVAVVLQHIGRSCILRNSCQCITNFATQSLA